MALNFISRIYQYDITTESRKIISGYAVGACCKKKEEFLLYFLLAALAFVGVVTDNIHQHLVVKVILSRIPN